MQTYNIDITETTELEIDRYLDFIAEDSLESTLNWYDNLYEKIASLSSLAL